MDITGKVVVITGATSGLGQAAAIAFAQDGAHVIIVGRDAARAEETRTQAGGRVDVVLGDTSTTEGVRAVAAAIVQKAPRIDVLINNAGGTFPTLSTTKDGVEKTLALNTFGPWLLARALHGALAAAKGRAVNVATGFLDTFPITLPELNTPKKYSGFNQYARSKLATVMMTVEQAAAEKDGVTWVSIHPGIIMGTRFNGGTPALMQVVFGPLMRGVGLACTLDEAVRRFRVAAFDDVKSGSYMQKGLPSPLPKQAADATVRGGVMGLLEQLAGGTASTAQAA